MIKRLCVLIPLLFAPASYSQQIVSADQVSVALPGMDSCRAVSTPQEVRAIISSTGWTKSYSLPNLDWRKKIFLVTFGNHFSEPSGSACNQDGTKILIKPTASNQFNSGVFLVTIDGQIGASNCSIFRERSLSQKVEPTTRSQTTSRTQSTTAADIE